MTNQRRAFLIATAFSTGLWVAAADWARAQEQPGLSSGSGQGTGSGRSSGVQRNRSGSISGSGPDRLVPLNQGPGERPPLRGGIRGLGPGVDVRFPNDPYVIPFMTLAEQGGPIDPNAPTGVTNDLLKNARLITTARERSLALQRIANSAIASNQLFLAHQILEEAVNSATVVEDPLVRDQRLIAIVTSLNILCDALLREGQKPFVTIPSTVAPLAPTPAPPQPAANPDALKPEDAPRKADGIVFLRLARLEWKRGAYLCGLIGNPTYRNEMLYKVADSASSGSASIANEYENAYMDVNARPDSADSPKLKEIRAAADGVLVESFDYASRIDRLIWKYRAMVRIALEAADSGQYERGLELSRKIDNAESRTEALLLLAESESRNGSQSAATQIYQEAAHAAASI